MVRIHILSLPGGSSPFVLSICSNPTAKTARSRCRWSIAPATARVDRKRGTLRPEHRGDHAGVIIHNNYYLGSTREGRARLVRAVFSVSYTHLTLPTIE